MQHETGRISAHRRLSYYTLSVFSSLEPAELLHEEHFEELDRPELSQIGPIQPSLSPAVVITRLHRHPSCYNLTGTMEKSYRDHGNS